MVGASSALSVSRLPIATFGSGGALRLRVGSLDDCRPAGVRGPHAHEFFAVVYFDRDSGGWHQVGGVRDRPRVGQVVTVPAGVVHEFGEGADAAGTVVSFMRDALTPSAFPRLPLTGDTRWGPFAAAHGGSGMRVEVPPRRRAEVRRLIDGLAHELREQRPGSTIAAAAHLSLLLVLLSRVARSACPGPPVELDPVVADVLDLIEVQYREPLSLADVATALARSPRHLTRTVREATGKTVMELIDDRRMDEARRLLVETDEKVDVIGYAVGYGDGSYFARRFRRAHGVAPSVWRRLRSSTSGSRPAHSARR